MGGQRTARTRCSIGSALVVVGALLTACGTPAGTTVAPETVSVTAAPVITSAADTDGDPNAAGRALATASPSPAAPSGGAAGGGAGICANETLADSMTRAVDNGASVLLATGGFTGTVAPGDGEIGVPYSEVTLTEGSTLAGPAVATPVSAWVPGDLAATGQASATGETSSLWARGGRLIAVVDPASGGSGLPGPVIRVAPVVGHDVVMGWVGCWSTQGVPSRDFAGTVDLFDDRGRHPTEMQLAAVGLDDFRSALPAG